MTAFWPRPGDFVSPIGLTAVVTCLLAGISSLAAARKRSRISVQVALGLNLLSVLVAIPAAFVFGINTGSYCTVFNSSHYEYYCEYLHL